MDDLVLPNPYRVPEPPRPGPLVRVRTGVPAAVVGLLVVAPGAAGATGSGLDLDLPTSTDPAVTDGTAPDLAALPTGGTEFELSSSTDPLLGGTGPTPSPDALSFGTLSLAPSETVPPVESAPAPNLPDVEEQVLLADTSVVGSPTRTLDEADRTLIRLWTGQEPAVVEQRTNRCGAPEYRMEHPSHPLYEFRNPGQPAPRAWCTQFGDEVEGDPDAPATVPRPARCSGAGTGRAGAAAPATAGTAGTGR